MSDDTKITYQTALRRLLIDMHIPDYDSGFLAQFDAEKIAKQSIETGANGIMLYFQSHVGLCNWPTKSGEQHRAFVGQDPMASLVDALNNSGVGTCAYYSTMFNTWAFNEHPDWRINAAAPASMGVLPMSRYGLCCPNHPGYHQFVIKQASEIALNYKIDSLFFDMMWWPAVCLCEHCQSRCIDETGLPIPETINWNDPHWCNYQQLRERWITDFAIELKELIHQLRPGTSVYHNFALGMSNWSKGVSFASSAGHDFLGGDFYGGRSEQLVISKLMMNLSVGRPTEFMTTVARNLIDHEQLQNEQEIENQVLGATGSNSAFLMIAAVDPDGNINRAMLERIKAVYDKTRVFEPFIGGEAIEDIGVYFSDSSKMNFADNGIELVDFSCAAKPDYPHFDAVKGACNKLSAAHLPFGVITSQRLNRLDEYNVIILPNLLRISLTEIDAFREYVKQGGHLYASRMTSLTIDDGTRLEDFALADLFGCHFSEEMEGRISYSSPNSELIKTSLSPERYLGHRNVERNMMGAVRLSKGDGETLATLSLPFGFPNEGTTSDHNWSSIHSDPPWTHLQEPNIVQNKYGKGRVIYSAADIEAGDSQGCCNVFTGLINALLEHQPSFSADTHPAVWMNVYEQLEDKRFVISFLNYQLENPTLPIKDISFQIAAPVGKRFMRLIQLPSMMTLPIEISDSGSAKGTLDELESFAMLALEYE